jgi:hypothetical protein
MDINSPTPIEPGLGSQANPQLASSRRLVSVFVRCAPLSASFMKTAYRIIHRLFIAGIASDSAIYDPRLVAR